MTSGAVPCPVCSQPASERKFRPFCSAECSNIDLDRVRLEMVAGLEQLAETLMGPPSVRKPQKWRWGSKGSFVLEMHGRKRGTWHDKESERGGGPFHLIAHARSCAMGEAIAFARDWTGGTPNAGVDYKAEQAARQADRDRKAREHAAADAEDEAKAVAVAQRMWRQAVAIEGTVAERYLRDARRIPAVALPPDAIRFHRQTLSLMVGATLPDGTVRGVQRVHLTPEGQKRPHTLEEPTKATNGRMVGGAAVRLPGAIDGPLLLAEGPETGLSVWAATGHETWIALGGMGGLVLPPGRQMVACRDDDPKHSPGDRKMSGLVAAWRAAGHRIAVATPWPFRQYDKTDFNDTLKLDGVRGARRRIEAALNPGGGPAERLPIRVVRKQLQGAISRFFNDVREFEAQGRALPGEEKMVRTDLLSWDEDVPELPEPETTPALAMPVHAIRVDVGAGKSFSAIQEAIRLLREMRAVGDKRSAAFAVPTHALGDELAAVFELHARGTGLRVAVWRGMTAMDPDSPGEAMCRNLDAVQDAREAMADPLKSVCRSKLPDGTVATCPFFETCGYQRQRSTKADLWLCAHDLVFGSKPSTMGRLAFLVVDEASWAAGLDGIHGKPTAISLDAIAQPVPSPLGATVGQRMDLDRLEYLRSRLLDTLRPLSDGPIAADPMNDSDLTLANTREAFSLEWQRMVDPAMHAGMSKAERREAVRRAADNAMIPRRASVWKAMTALLEDGGPQRSGWLALATQPSEDGPVRVLHLKGRRPIRQGWQVPTLLIDATLDLNLVRPYWPTVELTAELLADAPNQHIRQVVDRSFGKSAIEPLTEDMQGFSPEEARRRQRGLRAAHAIVNREARRYGGADVLLVTQRGVREALPSFGPMASGIDLAHHNAVSGQDRWRDVRALIVVGRTQPSPASVERMAEALTGRAVERVDGWYSRGDGVRHTAAGGAVAIEADRHPDPIAEAIRWQICEGELVQIIGRGRGVNRTEDNPLDVLVLTDAPLPMQVATTLQAADMAPSPEDLMAAAGGIVLENAADVAAAYPHLWATRNAAKFALHRWRAEVAGEAEVGIKPLIEDIYRGLIPTSPGFTRLAYQVAGPGKSPAVAWVDQALVTNPVATLAKMLGRLAWPSLPDPEPPDPPPDPPSRRVPVPAETEVHGVLDADAWWIPPPDRYDGPEGSDDDPEAQWPAAGNGREQPDTMEQSMFDLTDAAVVDLPPAGLLEPAVLFRPGLSLAPHPNFPLHDAFPVRNLVRIRRRDLPELVVADVARPFRVIRADPSVAPPPRPLLRVQGSDGWAEPVGLAAGRIGPAGYSVAERPIDVELRP